MYKNTLNKTHFSQQKRTSLSMWESRREEDAAQCMSSKKSMNHDIKPAHWPVNNFLRSNNAASVFRKAKRHLTVSSALLNKKKLPHLLSLKSGEKMSFPGWSTDLHIRPSIRMSSQQHFSRWIWSARLSSMKPGRHDTQRNTMTHSQELETYSHCALKGKIHLRMNDVMIRHAEKTKASGVRNGLKVKKSAGHDLPHHNQQCF